MKQLLNNLSVFVVFICIYPPLCIGFRTFTGKVNILTYANFETSVIGQNHATLVEFYHSDCSHSKHFAPVYKELAEICWPWRDIVIIMAIDCASAENNKVCEEYGVTSFPTMKYFSPNYQPSEYNKGISIETEDPVEIKKTISMLVKQETPASDNWPNFSSLTAAEVPHLFQDLPKHVLYVVFIFNSDKSSALGAQTILNFNRYPQMQFRRISDRKLAERFYLNPGNRLCAVDRNMNLEVIPYSESTVNGYTEALEQFIIMKKLTEKPDFSSTSLSNENTMNKNGLEQAIRHVFGNKIPKISDITEERLSALQRFINLQQRNRQFSNSGQISPIIPYRIF